MSDQLDVVMYAGVVFVGMAFLGFWLAATRLEKTMAPAEANRAAARLVGQSFFILGLAGLVMRVALKGW